MEPVVMITLCGAGKGTVLATLAETDGVPGRELREKAAAIVSQSVADVVLLNLDEPMFVVDDMGILKDTRIGVRSSVRGG